MTVYVVNKTKHEDTSPAQAFGELEYVNFNYIFADQIAPDGSLPAQFVEYMAKAADRYDPERDYVLIVGDHLQLIAFTSMLAVRYSHYRALRYDREAGGYYPVRVNGTIDATVTPA